MFVCFTCVHVTQLLTICFKDAQCLEPATEFKQTLTIVYDPTTNKNGKQGNFVVQTIAFLKNIDN